jgi:cysteine synthase A
MRQRGETGSIVTLLGDRGDRYRETLFDRNWLTARGISLEQPIADLRELMSPGA